VAILLIKEAQMQLNFSPPALPTFDPNDVIKNACGDDLAFIIVVRQNANEVVIYEKAGLSNPAKPGLPKDKIKLENLVDITVLCWEGSPGCRTVCSNGTCYEKC
jgi:hypothetical protein